MSEAIALAGVVFAAGATIERIRRMEAGARGQYKRIGDLTTEVAELRGQVSVLVGGGQGARGVVTGMIPSNLVDDEDTPRPRTLPPRAPGK